MSIKRNLRVGRMSSEGRLFQIEFWEEDFCGTVLSWVGVYEVLEVGRCGKHTEQLKEIKTYWTDDERRYRTQLSMNSAAAGNFQTRRSRLIKELQYKNGYSI